MNTKPKRKYGDIRKGAETTAGTNESVFDKFLPPSGSPVAKTPPSTSPSTRPRSPGGPAPSPSALRGGADASPRRDFQKVANSITREALPAGMFNGKAKQLYDCLYSLTRGAVVPLMSVRISRAELMKKSDIGSKVTLEQNLRRLIAAGFVSMKMIGGIQGGNEYTVYLPEEVTRPSIPPSTGPSPPTPPSPSYPPQKLGGVPPPETRGARRGVNVENTDRSGNAKTSFKTNTEIDDDEAFAQLLAHLRQAAAEVTGREASASEAERWGELGELLATELKIAAGRTGSVSSVPAFLTEHLRRRLWKKEKAQLEREAVDSSPAAHQSQPTSDASKCPDCFGTGMWYPEGYEKGVARCRHERLR